MTVAPQNLDAEQYVLGALMLAGDPAASVFDAILETGLRRDDFYLDKHGQIFAACYALRDRGDPVHVLTAEEELRRQGQLDDAGGSMRLREIRALAVATPNAPHFARLVVEASQRRHAIRVGGEIAELGMDHETDGGRLVLRAQELIEQLAERTGAIDELKPLWWHEAVHEPIPETSEYVDGVLQAGVLADIVGLPYLHKTAIALELATKIARGTGKLFGKFDITAQANVAYFWSDDSRAKELERIQAYAAACSQDVAPLAFYLNTGLALPDGIPMLKAQIRRHGFRLIVLDSLYNFAPGLDWVKDTASVSLLYHHLKRLCDQIEGLTIVLVDHASKPSDSNRGRDVSVSSYGSVWKAAAVRSSIVITKDTHGLKATAIGNNIKGFPTTPVRFDDESLELRIVEQREGEKEADLDELVLSEVHRNPGASTGRIARNVHKRKERVAEALARLERENLVYNTYGTGSQLPGTTAEPESAGAYSEAVPRNTGTAGNRYAWFPVNQAESMVPTINGTAAEPSDPATVTGGDPANGSQTAPLRSRGRAGAGAAPETVDDDIDFT